MLIAGKMMWAEIVNANCSRASTRTSLVSSMRLALLPQPHRSLLSHVHLQTEEIRPRAPADNYRDGTSDGAYHSNRCRRKAKCSERPTLCVHEHDSTPAESSAQSAIPSLQVLDPCGGLSLEP